MTKATKLDAEIGERIRIYRVTRKRSQSWLGEKIKRSRQQVENYESGKNRISASCLLEVSKILKVSIEKFFSN